MTVSFLPRNALIAALALIALSSGVCAFSSAHAEMVFRRGEAGDPSTFDPQKTSTVIEADALYDLFEGLLTYDSSGALAPGAAESWSVSADGLTYVFRLREARWSNGDPVRADDFVFTFRRLLDPATGAEYANLYYPIRNAEAVAKGEAAPSVLGVRAIDGRTLEITLERPTPYFLAVVAHQTSAPINPRNVAEFGRAFARPGNLVSNGAFRLAAFTPNDETVLVKNPKFHAARDVKIDKEIIASIDDRAAGFLRFRAGEIDSYDDAPRPTGSPSCARSSGVAADFHDLSPIEREDRARELLKEAGFGDGRPLSIEIRYITSENNKATAIAIADMWKPLGVTASFVNSDVKTHFGLLQNGGDFDVARVGWIGDYADPQNFLFLFESGNGRLNYARWSNAAYDRLMRTAAGETDLRTRAKTLAEAERLLLEEEPVIPLLFYESKNMVSRRVKGWRDNLLDRHLARYLSIGPGEGVAAG